MKHYKLVNKNKSKLMKVISWILKPFCSDFMLMTTTLGETIYYGIDTDINDYKFKATLEHELIHVAQFKKYTWFGMAALYLFFPLPVFFSGRWFIEREAYLHNIICHQYNIGQVVQVLHEQYFRPWPRKRMYKWFKKHSSAESQVKK